MIRTKILADYCTKRLLKFSIEDDILLIENYALIIVDNKTTIFNKEWKFIPPEFDNERKYEGDLETNGYVYEFGGRWYIQEWETGEEEISMQELAYIGEPNTRVAMNSFIGIHSGNEILNGVGIYKNWIQKAKFLGIKNLGICEKNTLTGVINFQNICAKNDMKSIIGMSISVSDGSETFDVKLYAQNFEGWLNLLELNKIINVDEKLFISVEQLLSHLGGIFLIADPKTLKFGDMTTDLYGAINYYQIDTVVFENEDIDKEYIDNFEKYLRSDLRPILLVDAYYLEQEDWRAREILWGISKKFDFKTKNQYFKSNDEIAKELIQMFGKGFDSWVKLFQESSANLEKLVENCNFKYDTVNRRLPKYEMTKVESVKFDTNEELFLHYIKQGFIDRKVSTKKHEEYIKRLKIEISVLKKGDVIDYFLITRDFIQESHDQDILVGIGRGSAGGSLVSYLLGIIQINPLELDLLFERFLNEGRMGKMGDCKAYKIQSHDGQSIILNEGSLLKIKRNEKIKIISVEGLQFNDEIIKYN
jgi:DNA polymerase-3 subunit alpha